MHLDGLKCNDARVINKPHAVLAQAWGLLYRKLTILLYRNNPSRLRIYSMRN